MSGDGTPFISQPTDIIFSVTCDRSGHIVVHGPEVPPEQSCMILLNTVIQILFSSFEKSRIIKPV